MTSYYDSFDYPSYWKKRVYEDRAEKIALKKLLKKINSHGKIIDLGGGFGRLAETYSPFFQECLIVEPSGDLIRTGKEKNRELKNVTFLQDSLPKLSSIKDRTFDLALMVRVIHHIKEPEIALKEVERILKDNGFLIIEVANKIHFLAKLRAVFVGNFDFSKDEDPIDRRSLKSVKENKIPFFNHHPKKILKILNKLNFETVEILSVSNFRRPVFKKIIPLPVLLLVENLLQKPLAKIFFGPSIFILAQKTKK